MSTTITNTQEHEDERSVCISELVRGMSEHERSRFAEATHDYCAHYGPLQEVDGTYTSALNTEAGKQVLGRVYGAISDAVRGTDVLADAVRAVSQANEDLDAAIRAQASLGESERSLSERSGLARATVHNRLVKERVIAEGDEGLEPAPGRSITVDQVEALLLTVQDAVMSSRVDQAQAAVMDAQDEWFEPLTGEDPVWSAAAENLLAIMVYATLELRTSVAIGPIAGAPLLMLWRAVTDQLLHDRQTMDRFWEDIERPPETELRAVLLDSMRALAAMVGADGMFEQVRAVFIDAMPWGSLPWKDDIDAALQRAVGGIIV